MVCSAPSSVYRMASAPAACSVTVVPSATVSLSEENRTGPYRSLVNALMHTAVGQTPCSCWASTTSHHSAGEPSCATALTKPTLGVMPSR